MREPNAGPELTAKRAAGLRPRLTRISAAPFLRPVNLRPARISARASAVLRAGTERLATEMARDPARLGILLAEGALP